jgi:hypothetical protein
MLLACSEPFELQKATQVPAAGNVTTQGIVVPVPTYAWRSVGLPFLPGPPDHAYVTNDPEQDKRTLFVNGNAYWFIGSVIEYPYKLNKATLRWEKFEGPEDIANMFLGAYEYFFDRGNKYYMSRFNPGPGYGDERIFYAHDIVTGETDALPEFPGTLTTESAFVVVGDKMYLLGGRTSSVVSSQFWELNLTTGVWKNKGSLPGGARASTVAVVIDDRVYFGMGYDYIYYNGQPAKRYKDDWYSMNPAGNGSIAAERADFPGLKRREADGFAMNNKIYVGWGRSSAGTYLNDFWEFNPSSNTWTQRADCPADHGGPSNMDAFALGDRAFFVRGWLGECWRYDNDPYIVGPAATSTVEAKPNQAGTPGG